MKSNPFDVIAKYQKPTVPVVTSTDATEGPIIAVEICSNVLEAHIWLALDDDFTPGDGLAVFYADELPFLATKDVQTLKEIHQNKLAFRGRVRQ